MNKSGPWPDEVQNSRADWIAVGEMVYERCADIVCASEGVIGDEG